MAIKSIVILLVAFICANADLIHFIAEGSISSISIQQQPPGAGAPSGSTPDYLPAIPEIGDLLVTEVLIDTDHQGSVMVNGTVIDPSTSFDPSAGNFQITSYLPLLVSSSCFPLINELNLQNDNSTVIRNVWEHTAFDQTISEQPPSDFTMIEYNIGSVSADQSGFSLPYAYFSTVFLSSDLISIAEGDTAIIIEGFVDSRVIDGAPVITITYLKAKEATVHSFNRITQVPEPSTGTLFTTAVLLCSVLGIFKTGIRRKN